MNALHPNEIRNAQERQRLHCHGYGNAEPEDELSRVESCTKWFDDREQIEDARIEARLDAMAEREDQPGLYDE